MKRSWIVRRTTLGRHDAARRWDQAYVHLLCWALPKETINKEVPDASGDLRPGFDLPERSLHFASRVKNRGRLSFARQRFFPCGQQGVVQPALFGAIQ